MEISTPVPTSPPPRSRASSATSSTKYSIDLDVLLDRSKADDSILTLPGTQGSDGPITSEDIDGPSDFTQNLEYWMRARPPNVVAPVRLQEGDAARDLEEYIASDDDEGGEEDQEDQEDQEEGEEAGEESSRGGGEEMSSDRQSAPSRNDEEDGGTGGEVRDELEEEDEVSDILPDDPSVEHYHHAEPSGYVDEDDMANLSAMMVEDEEKALSLLEDLPDDQSTKLLHDDKGDVQPSSETLKPCLLQPTVEEYAETPRRIASNEASSVDARPATPSMLTISAQASQISDLQDQFRQQKAESDAKIAELQKELTTRTEDLRAAHGNEMDLVRARFEAQTAQLKVELAEAQDQLQHAQADNAAMDVETAQAAARHDEEVEAIKSELGTRIADLESTCSALRIQLDEARDQADQARKDAATAQDSLSTIRMAFEEGRNGTVTELTGLQSTCSALRVQLDEARKQIEAVRRDAVIAGDDLYTMQRALEEERSGSITKLANLESSLSTLRSQLDDARTQIDEARQDASTARDELDAIQQSHDDEQRATTARLTDLSTERDDLVSAHASSQDSLSALRAELAALREQHQHAIDTMRAKAELAVRKAGDLLDKEKSERQAAQQAATAHRNEADALRDAHERLQRQTASDRQALGTINDALATAEAEASAARAEAEAARREMEALREDSASVNQAMDERIAELLRAREREWARRFEALLSERKVMGKALLREWGREECGVGEPQAYRYRYVKS